MVIKYILRSCLNYGDIRSAYPLQRYASFWNKDLGVSMKIKWRDYLTGEAFLRTFACLKKMTK